MYECRRTIVGPERACFSMSAKNKTALQMKAVVKQRFWAARYGAYLCKQCWLPCIVKWI